MTYGSKGCVKELSLNETGVIFLYQARKEAGVEKVFNTKEIVAIVVLALFAAVSLAMFAMGMV